jgi:O-antigen ligase
LSFSAFFLSLSQKTHNAPPYLLAVILSCYLLASVINPAASDLMVILLLIAGFIGILGSFRYLKSNPLMLFEKVFLSVFALYTVISVVSFLYWPATRNSHMRVEDDLKFLLFIPLYLVFRRYEFNAQLMVAIFVLFSIVLGVVSVLIFVQGCCSFKYWPDVGPYFDILNWNRPSGSVNPMRYAVVALIMSVFLVNYRLIFVRSGGLLNALAILGVGLSLLACFLTQTRGVWLATPILFLAYLFYLFKKGSARFLWVWVFVGLVSIFAVFQTDILQQRVDRTFHDLELYQQGDSNSSVGARLDMYEFSFSLFLQKPVFGHGLGVFKAKAQEARNSGLLDGKSSAIGVVRTPHNEFFLALVERGIIGLLAVCMLFIIPCYIFYRAAMDYRGKTISYFGLSGLGMMIIFFVAGQTGTLFNHNVFTHFYILVTLLFVSQIVVQYEFSGSERTGHSSLS